MPRIESRKSSGQGTARDAALESGLPLWRRPFLLSSSIRKAYPFSMTKLLDRAVEAARNLPPETPDERARMLLQFAGVDQPVIELTPRGARRDCFIERSGRARRVCDG